MIAIIGILAVIVLVAVQQSRESARRLACQSNLRQIGLAIANYDTLHRVYPPGATLFGNNLHVSILPFMEQEELYSQLMSRYAVGNYASPSSLPGITTFVCPSDPAPTQPLPLVGTNYSGNSGTWLLDEMRWDGTIVPWLNMSNEEIRLVRHRDISDGLTNTSMVSEILRADGSHSKARAGWYTPSTHTDIDVFARTCRSIPDEPVLYGWQGDPFMLGTPWTSGSVTATLFNHVLTPNQPTCFNGGGVPEAAATAASMHSHGVNTLFADGSLRFISDDVSVGTWRAFASRDGNEAHQQ